MSFRISSILALACVGAAALCAATDPFAGTWRLNRAKCKVSGQQWKIEELGQNRFRFTFGAETNTITADGTDQPIEFGRTEAITFQSPAAWKVVIKKDGKVQSTSIQTLSADGKKISSKGRESRPDGSSGDFQGTFKRVGAGSGWAGTWESGDVKVSSPDQVIISLYQGDGLTFQAPSYKSVLNMKFDGKEYAETGPSVPAGSTSSGKRVNANTIEFVDRIKDRVIDHTKVQVSKDGKTMTMTVRNTGQPRATTIIYEKK